MFTTQCGSFLHDVVMYFSLPLWDMEYLLGGSSQEFLLHGVLRFYKWNMMTLKNGFPVQNG